MSWYWWVIIIFVCSAFSFILGGSLNLGREADKVLSNIKEER